MTAPAVLFQQWSLPEPCSVTPLTGGTNNEVWRVTDAADTPFVLRVLPESTSMPRQQTEFALLHALQALGVPFHLPIPHPARDGTAIVALPTGEFATLTPFLPGNDPDRASLAHAAQAGRALAALDEGLAHLALPTHTQVVPPYGAFTAWHPLVAEPFSALERLPITRAQCDQLHRFLAEVQTAVSALYQRLPQQIVHRDYSPGNFLMTEGQISSILDFEYMGPDLRALDLVVALSWWNVPAMMDDTNWPLFAAFASAYLALVPFAAVELQALPMLFRLRDATSFIHRMGRYLAGQESDARMSSRVEHTLWREQWIAANDNRLLDEAAQW